MPQAQKGMSDEDWYVFLTQGEQGRDAFRRMIRKVPSAPRCKMCYVPFGGFGGRFNRLRGNGPSRKNPNFCAGCFEAAPMGGAEIDVGILFADVRSFTSMSEERGPKAMAALMNRFYELATDVLTAEDAIIDKLVGDEVMALFVPGFAGEEYLPKMLTAAEQLLSGVGCGTDDQWLNVGVGLDAGIAYVGNVGSGDVKDFTAIGDPVNTAARLQATAGAGKIVLSERVYEHARDRYPDAPASQLDLKGKSELVAVRTIDLNVGLFA